jgi:DNA ligase 1
MKKVQQQSSLDSFFGAQSAKPKKGPQQKKLGAFFGSSKVSSTKEPKASTPISPTDMSSAAVLNTQSESVVEASPNDRLAQNDAAVAASPLKNSKDGLQKEGKDIDHDDEDDDMEEDIPVVSTKKRISSSQMKKRRVIEDSDDDDALAEEAPPEPPMPEAVLPEKPTEPRSKRTKKTKILEEASPKQSSDDAPDPTDAPAIPKDESIPDEAVPAEPSAATGKVAASKKNDAIKTTKSLVTKVSKTSSENGKCSYPSDEELLQSMPTSDHPWLDNEPIPYYMVCQTFHEIEQITSRLQIQEIMTSLIRRVLLKHTVTSNAVQQRDLQALLYLASNTVAPAYECVELGIGDALLIKAIGQATGTNPAMVKQKYETLGDLGTVAQTYKSKQSTLGGFFAKSGATPKTAKKTYLTAQEVWLSFQQIAQTKGNHSQQWKVDIIKKMLVRTIDPMETKYIIRGLQGKLRIGLAQSTVLIAFAHAFTLTQPKSIASDESDDKLTDGTIIVRLLQYAKLKLTRFFVVSLENCCRACS